MMYCKIYILQYTYVNFNIMICKLGNVMNASNRCPILIFRNDCKQSRCFCYFNVFQMLVYLKPVLISLSEVCHCVVLVTVYFFIGLLQIPDGILKQSRGATPRVGVSKCHRVSVANQQENITVIHLYHSHAYTQSSL